MYNNMTCSTKQLLQKKKKRGPFSNMKTFDNISQLALGNDKYTSLDVSQIGQWQGVSTCHPSLDNNQ